MGIREQLTEDLKAAMREKDQLRMDTIRNVRGSITNREVELGETLDDASVMQVIRGLVKQRDDSIAQYEQGGRADLADSERREKAILEGYLPAAPDAAVIARAVDEVVTALGASGMKDMGRVMKEAKERLGPGVGGKELSEAVKARLSR